MPLDVPRVQEALRADGIDGWLLYDFHGSNPIARRIVGLDHTSKLTTRRWYYLVPAHGEPRALVHRIESRSLEHLPGTSRRYAQRQELADGLKTLLEGCRVVALEYSPGGAIPYVSRVDGGTIDAIRALGVEVVSSGDLVQRFEAIWDPQALDLHRQASKRLYRIKDRAFETAAARSSSGSRVTEYEIQQLMVGWFAEEGLVTDSPPVVAAQSNSGDPHYQPTAARHREIGRHEILLLDLWGKLDQPEAVYADITWVGFTGRQVPDEYSRVFDVARNARDAAIEFVQQAIKAGRDLRGWQVDRAAREVVERAGLAEHFVHRTGHSLGKEVHGNGVHMDDYETHDDRRLLEGTGFTIEPGVYFERFGVRTEINMYVSQTDAHVTGPAQTSIVALG
jgi:Xaa-Pro aminopeptidase